MPVTQRDIAERLNLSQSTVAKVLKNSPNVWVSAENRERILGLARELNYRPNMRFGRYSAVTCAYVTPPSHVTRLAYNMAIDVLAERLGALGYELKVKIFQNQTALLECLRGMERNKDSAACVLWGEEPVVEEQGVLLENLGIPFVTKGRFENEHPDWLQIDFDHEDMMARSVQHLASLGRTRIAYLGQSDAHRYIDLLRKGYLGAMADRGLAIPDGFVVEGDATTESGERAMDAWLALPADERPTALVLGAGTAPWHGVEKALLKKGLRAGDNPDEFAVAGTSFSDLMLTVGHGHAFRNIMLDELTSAMVDRLLSPLLKDEEISETIVRLRPELLPIPSLEVLGKNTENPN